MIEKIKYEKMTTSTYAHRRNNLLTNETIKKMGLTYTILGTTTYNYPIEKISIGHGEKEIFLIAGTHASEIIGIDFITQLLEHITEIGEFDPNTIKLNIIPIQNPEGYDIINSVLEKIKTINFEKKSKEYYLRYRTDALIYNVLKDLNNLKNEPDFINALKNFIETNPNWKQLERPNAMPKITHLNKKIKELKINHYPYLELINAIEQIKQTLDTTNIHDLFLIEFLKKLRSFFIAQEINLNNLTKLHQQMFQTLDLNSLNIQNQDLKQKTIQIYKKNPKGSIINHDPTGEYINLNANQPANPGIEIIKNQQKKYMTGTKSNLRNYYEGPMGIPCTNPYNFSYAIENQIIQNELNISYESGKYLATILYHGTGGIIYYKPSEPTTFDQYNQELAEAYNEGITEYRNSPYRKIEEISTTGYGDVLRKKYPGVLLIELSKMGGNPIGPYGDITNIEATIKENISGVNKMLKYLKQKKPVK